MTTATALLTAEDLVKVPSDHVRHELVKGELRIMPPAGKKLGLVETAILHALLNFVSERDLGVVTGGDTGYLIARNPDTVLAPDVGFIQADRAARSPDEDVYWPFAPDLAVEVLSPSDSAMDVDEKVSTWLSAGAKMVWVANPRMKTVIIHTTGNPPEIRHYADMIDGGTVLPGFRLELRSIFPQPK